MDSLRIGKEIYSLLNGCEALTKLVGNRIYPIIVEKETSYPFIVYRRTTIIPDYTKDFHFKDSVLLDIICVSNDYSESIDIASIVRGLLEDKRFKQLGIDSIKVESAEEDFIDDAYIQTISFNITTLK